MKQKISTTIILAAVAFICYGQNPVVVDGDKIYLKDSLGGEVMLLTYIERGGQNLDAMWITYDRRPLVDPWLLEAVDQSTKYSEDNFLKYWREKDVRILGALTTYDDCRCFKTKTASSPDMYLIHFKIFAEDWNKLKKLYPEIEHHIRKVNAQ